MACQRRRVPSVIRGTPKARRHTFTVPTLTLKWWATATSDSRRTALTRSSQRMAGRLLGHLAVGQGIGPSPKPATVTVPRISQNSFRPGRVLGLRYGPCRSWKRSAIFTTRVDHTGKCPICGGPPGTALGQRAELLTISPLGLAGLRVVGNHGKAVCESRRC